MIPNRGHLLVYNEAKRIKTAIVEMLGLSQKYYVENRMKQSGWKATLTIQKP
jgi:hypothetical protein